MAYHQIDSDISLPSDPDLLRSTLRKEPLEKIHGLVGLQELTRIASVTHEEVSKPDWSALAEQEGKDLAVLREAISKVTGANRPWIIGYASEFASALLKIFPG